VTSARNSTVVPRDEREELRDAGDVSGAGHADA